MFRRDTVFIVGAGASSEVDMPVGSKLATRISELMFFDFVVGRPKRGDDVILDAWRGRFTDSSEFDKIMRAAGRISTGVPSVKSIDSFLHNHEHDQYMKFCGKTAIVRAILEAERASKLFVDRNKGSQFTKLNEVNNTWYSGFASKLVDKTTKDDLSNLFDGISIVCFNYDRCIQHFLIHRLMPIFGLSQNEAEKAVASLKIYHPYGTVGKLPTLSSPGGIPFGASVRGEALLELTGGIRTFNERVDDADSIEKVKKLIENAETLVFLGFGFHEQNIDLLTPSNRGDVQRAFGTALKISDFDCSGVRANIRKLGCKSGSTIQINNNLNCNTLFQDFDMSL